MKGKLILVGAGPGDPGLITVKGLTALREADVVLYDRLANPLLLAEAREDAERIDVGKVPHRQHGVQQDWINEVIREKLAENRTVVRLKGGDPFVFGRGGEEWIVATEMGSAVEVIPGVTSAIAVPAVAGIPVTHRGVANAFGVFTGHNAEAGQPPPWAAAALLPTAIFLMGIERLPAIVSNLIEHGVPGDRPVAVISQGTLPQQIIVVATLETILERAQGVPAPAIVVVGESVLALP